MAIENFIRVQVEPMVEKYFSNFYPLKNGAPVIELTDRLFLDSSILNFIKNHGRKYFNHIPKKGSSMLVLKTKGVLGTIGLDSTSSAALGLYFLRYVREKLVQETFYYQSLPGISVTEAIFIVFAKYDMGEYREDTFRRFFDRSVKNSSFSTDDLAFNRRINEALKKIYDEKYVEYLDSLGS